MKKRILVLTILALLAAASTLLVGATREATAGGATDAPKACCGHCGAMTGCGNR